MCASLGSSEKIALVFFCLLFGNMVTCARARVRRAINASTISSIMNIPRDVPTFSTASLFKNTTLGEGQSVISEVPTSTRSSNLEFLTTQLVNETETPTSSTTEISSSTVESTSTPKVVLDDCPSLDTIPNMDSMTQEEFTTILTDSCRYDRLIKPPHEQLEVNFCFDMTHIETADHLQLKAHLLVQLRYTDYRLKYNSFSPTRALIMGEENLKNRIWTPHIILSNEKESTLMGLTGKDIFLQIFPDGQVVYAYRMSTLFYCWMDLKKFPFDHQVCDITWVSWAYNATYLILQWEQTTPYIIAQNLHLTEFVLEDTWIENNILPNSFHIDGEGKSGNYSSITFKLKLRREVGYYIMDYFLPSILLVCTSWVTFWLQADAAPPRVTLGTATMLSFITLNGGLSKNLPKVSYIKASEIWFLACASFIFFSLAEFAFVNVIWRRRKKVEMKKQNSVHILKGALTPSLARKHLRKANSMNSLHKARSCSSLDREIAEKNTQANYLTVHSFPSSLIVPTLNTHSQEDLVDIDNTVTTIPIPESHNPPPLTFTTMTPQEVAMWIDKKSRFVFPVAFLIFNIFYWSFVYVL